MSYIMNVNNSKSFFKLKKRKRFEPDDMERMDVININNKHVINYLIKTLKRKYEILDIGERKKYKNSNEHNQYQPYNCKLHDNDINICSIYECSGNYDELQQILLSYLS